MKGEIPMSKTTNIALERYEYDYFYGGEPNQTYPFYKCPKSLFTNKKYAKMSPLAKFLYILMLDRKNLSAKNKWYDSENRIYIYYTIKNVMEDLNVSKPTAIKLLNELEDYNFIERYRTDNNSKYTYYVKNVPLYEINNQMDNLIKVDFMPEPPSDEKITDTDNVNSTVQTLTNRNSNNEDNRKELYPEVKGNDPEVKNLYPEVNDVYPNKNNIVNNNISNTKQIRSIRSGASETPNTTNVIDLIDIDNVFENNICLNNFVDEQTKTRIGDEIDILINKIKQSINYEGYIPSEDKQYIDYLFDCVHEVLPTNPEFRLKDKGIVISRDKAEELLYSLKIPQIKNLISKIKSIQSNYKIKNKPNYVITTALNEAYSMRSYNPAYFTGEITKKEYINDSAPISSDKNSLYTDETGTTYIPGRLTAPKGVFNNYTQRHYSDEEIEEILRQKSRRKEYSGSIARNKTVDTEPYDENKAAQDKIRNNNKHKAISSADQDAYLRQKYVYEPYYRRLEEEKKAENKDYNDNNI